MNPIVGIGELLWDVYPDGRKVAGGAPFNFAFHCHQLGHPAIIVSRVGDDDLGRELREEVRRLGLSDEYIQTDREHPTGTVRVTLDENKVPSYTITENVAWDYIENLSQLSFLSEFSSGICFGTLGQRFRDSAKTIKSYVASANRNCFRVFDLNFRQPPIDANMLYTGLQRATWSKMNELELADVLKCWGMTHGSGIFPLRQIYQRLGLAYDKAILLTRGEGGCDVFSTNDVGVAEELHEPAVHANVVDTVGAGDAFTAAMVCLHLEGRPLRECARFANHYAARVCEHHGATPQIDRAEVERAAFGGR